MQIDLPGQPARSSRAVWVKTHARIRLGERTTLERQDLQELLAARRYVPLGLANPGIRALLVYSEPDDGCFVVLQDFHTRNVVTVLPLEYWKGGVLTENSAQAWQARNLALSEDAPAEQVEPLPESDAEVPSDVVMPPTDPATQAVLRAQETRRHLVSLLVAREEAARAELTQSYGSPEEQSRVTDERFYRLAGALDDVAVAEALLGREAGRARAGWLVLTLFRDPPEVALRVSRTLLCEDIAGQLEQPAFIAHIARKLVSRRLFNEDVRSIHVRVGECRYDFPADAQRSFLETCATAIAAAWPKF